VVKGFTWINAILAATAAARPFAEELPLEGDLDHLSIRQVRSGPPAGHPSTWWRPAIGHNSTTPLSMDSTFQYYRTAIQYGADNTGVNDASDGFNFAINGETHKQLVH
jgi:hypothetical protein